MQGFHNKQTSFRLIYYDFKGQNIKVRCNLETKILVSIYLRGLPVAPTGLEPVSSV